MSRWKALQRATEEDKRYEVYALADRHFYETPDRISAGEAPVYDTTRREVPDGWDAARIGDWLTLTPLGPDGKPAPGPSQGWKIHASATRANAERIAATVWDYCVPRRIAVKFVPAPHLLHLRNTEYAGRDTSGKFITIYPADEEQLHVVLRELGELLASATPERTDRLFPGDITQFNDGGGLGIAHGAAGVLYALDAVGAER